MLVRYKTELNKTRAHSSSEWLAPEHESRMYKEILKYRLLLLFFSFFWSQYGFEDAVLEIHIDGDVYNEVWSAA